MSGDPLPVIPCPLRPGIHAWIWPGGRSEGWRTAREQADRAVTLGLTGVIPQGGLLAPVWLEGRDDGDTLTRRDRFLAAGLQVTAGLGIDGASATPFNVAAAIVKALRDNETVMVDWESEAKWENDAGNALARAIDGAVLAEFPDAPYRCVDCPWWEPQYHSRAPTVVFSSIFEHRFVQAYGAPARGNPVEDTEWMLARARKHYPALGIAPDEVHPAEQMYGHSLVNAARLVLSGEPVIALWDIEEMDTPMRQALLARNALLGGRFAPTRDGVKAYQAAHGLVADGDVGPHTLAAMWIT